MKPAKILLADGNSSFLLGAMASLSQLPQAEIVGCNATAVEAIGQVDALSIDILVLDADTLVQRDGKRCVACWHGGEGPEWSSLRTTSRATTAPWLARLEWMCA